MILPLWNSELLSLLNHIFEDLKEAWATLLQVEFDHVDSEINPALINAISPNEIVVCEALHINLKRAKVISVL